jgi:hypothetical protein
LKITSIEKYQLKLKTSSRIFNRINSMSLDLKSEAKKIIDELPKGSTRDDLMHEVYIRQAVRILTFQFVL